MLPGLDDVDKDMLNNTNFGMLNSNRKFMNPVDLSLK